MMNRISAVLGAFLLTSTLYGFTPAMAAVDPNDALRAGAMSITKIDQFDSPLKAENFLGNISDCNGNSANGFRALGDDGIPVPDLNTIINLGQKLWQFIEANKAVANVSSQTANALPAGVQCWNQLSNWRPPRSEVYQVSYKNLFGYEVVNLQFALVYSWGGQLHGQGAYLTNATVQYRNLDVAWGWKVNANVEVPMVTNLGSESSPVAGMQVNVRWQVDALTHSESTASFFVGGDGRPTQQL